MKEVFDLFRVARTVTVLKVGVFSYVPQRGVRYNVPLKWVRPEKKHLYDVECSGDLTPMPKINPDIPYYRFEDSQELNTANDRVQKIFSLGNQLPELALKMYRQKLIQKVRNNSYDKSSLEVYIASLTATIRFAQEVIKVKPKKFVQKRIHISKCIERRKKLLKFLRMKDYKKFEWLLETLDLEYKPTPHPNPVVTRKQSLTLLAKLKVEQAKEEKLAALKKSYDEQKVPFLENKLTKLKDIKAKEEKYNLPVTVTDADIEECTKRLEEVKIQVAERARKGYVRKIHPYFLEPYDEDLLWEKEKAGEKIREELFKHKLIGKITN